MSFPGVLVGTAEPERDRQHWFCDRAIQDEDVPTDDDDDDEPKTEIRAHNLMEYVKTPRLRGRVFQRQKKSTLAHNLLENGK